MSVVKTMVCLANSRKLQGRCIAGRELLTDTTAGWVRPVSARLHEEVSEYERQYKDGSDPRVLDVIEVPLLEAKPKDYQQENWLLDDEHYWVKTGSLDWDDLAELIDAPDPLWVNGHSTFHGLNDQIPLDIARGLTFSLAFLRVGSLRLSVFAPQKAFGNPKRRVQGQFRHGQSEYYLWVTDPDYERRYLAEPDGEHELGECYLTVSLSEPYEGNCYKMVAAIIERP